MATIYFSLSLFFCYLIVVLIYIGHYPDIWFVWKVHMLFCSCFPYSLDHRSPAKRPMLKSRDIYIKISRNRSGGRGCLFWLFDCEGLFWVVGLNWFLVRWTWLVDWKDYSLDSQVTDPRARIRTAWNIWDYLLGPKNPPKKLSLNKFFLEKFEWGFTSD